jgi:hypothetical protein
LSWTLPTVALLMLGLTLIPAEVWQQPATDETYRGFDPNFIYTNPGGNGSIGVSRSSITIAAKPQSNPSANLATTLLRKLEVSVDTTILDSSYAGEPLRLGLWSPWTATGYFIVFGPAPDHSLAAELVTGGTPSTFLIGGTVMDSVPIGRYQLGSPYRVTFVVDKPAGRITTSISGGDVNDVEVLSASQSPAIFGNVQVSLGASAVAEGGTSHTVLNNYQLVIPHQRSWASRIADRRASAILIVLALVGALVGILAIVVHFRGTPLAPRQALRSGRIKLRSWLVFRNRILVVTFAFGSYLLGNVLLFPLGGHPFDMGDEKLFAYVGSTYGVQHLYFLPDTVSLASIWNGVPYVQSSFPYGPISAYFHSAIGYLAGLLFGSGQSLGLADLRVEYLIKGVNVAFGLGDAVLIHSILRRVNLSSSWSLAAAGLFLFNPAVWFSMSVWGQTHVISLFLVLAAVLLAENNRPAWAWLALVAACLTRPQMLVFGLLIGIALLRKFTWKVTRQAISAAVIVTFIVLLPLMLTVGPSLPVDVLLNTFRIQEGGGNVAVLTTVSQDAYSIWPLITYLAHGASGLERTFTPSSALLLGPVTYQFVSQVLTVAVIIVVSVSLAARRSVADAGGYLPFVALGIGSFLMLLTGIVATHFLLALPFLLLCRRQLRPVAYISVVVAWTIATFVPMYGDMGMAAAGAGLPLLAPNHNAITRFFVALYTWDRFITVTIAANMCALVWLAVTTLRAPITNVSSSLGVD